MSGRYGAFRGRLASQATESGLTSVSDGPTKRAMLELASARAQAEYLDLMDAWKILDTKSQGTTAIAGIVLGACLAWVGKQDIHIAWWQKAFLAMSVFLLLCSITTAVWCMRSREVRQPPSAETMFDDLEKIPQKHWPHLDEDVAADFHAIWLEDWMVSVSAVRKITVIKNNWLNLAHAALAFAAVLVSVVVLAEILFH